MAAAAPRSACDALRHNLRMANANLILAARMAEIEPFHVMDVQNRAHELEATGRRIVHMEIGQPDFAAPPLVAEAAIEAIRQRRLGYRSEEHTSELQSLRHLVCRLLLEKKKREIPESIHSMSSRRSATS